MSIPKSAPEARLLIANTIAEAVLSFQLTGDESESEADEICVNTENFVDQIIESLQINISSIDEKYGIVCTLNPIDPAEFIFSD